MRHQIYQLKRQNQQMSIVQQIKQISHSLDSIVKWQPAFEEVLSRLKAAQVELVDIASELGTWQSKIEFDDKKIATIQDRLSLGYGLQKKHKVQTTAELIAIKKQLETDLEAVLNLEEIIIQLTAPVRWTQSVNQMIQDGATSFTEVGPGKVLTGLVNKINKEVETINA